LGPAPLHSLARQIAYTKGPSGDNSEYLHELVEALKLLNDRACDAHLIELDTLVRSFKKTVKVTHD